MVKVPKYDQYPWRSVSPKWRKMATPHRGRLGKRPRQITSPLILALLEGKTLLVDYTMPFGREGAKAPFYYLYDFFTARGYQLHVCTVDDVSKGEYRKILLWLTKSNSKDLNSEKEVA